MLEGEQTTQQAQPAPQEDSRGRIVAALVLLVIALAGLALSTAYSFKTDEGRREMRDYQARMDMFQGKVILELTYYLEGMQGEGSPARAVARRYAPMGALSAARYFARAAHGFRDPDECTAAAASAAALYARHGDTMRALRVLQEALKRVETELGAVGPLPPGRRIVPTALDHRVLSFLVRLYAGQRPTPAWLRSKAAAWIPRHVPAHLLIEAQIAESLGRAQQADRAHQAMYEVGENMALRVSALMTAIGALILLGLGLLVWGTVRRSGFGPYRGLPQRPWGVWAGLELVGAWLVLSLVLQLLASLILGFVLAQSRIAFAATVLASYLMASVVALAWFAIAVTPRGSGLRTVGWRSAGVDTAIINGIGAYAAALPVVVGTALVLARLVPAPPVNPVMAELIRAQEWAGRAVFLVLLCVVAPVVEETVFRGGLYGGMRKRWSVPAAAIASAAIFAAVHLNWASFVPVMALGVALCVVYERTGSLLPSMVAHGLFNLVTTIAIFMLA